MTAQTIPRFLYAKSTDSVSEFREPLQKFSDMPLATTVAELVPSLPSMLVVETLTAALGAWLDGPAIEAMIERRNRMQADVAKLVAKKGESLVIVR